MLASPLQMAMVAATVANHGVLMQPHLLQEVVSPEGKSGTAEIGVNGKYDTWFIAFAPASNPKVAVAVALENQTGFGATTAGPIAKSIVQAVLPQRSNT